MGSEPADTTVALVDPVGDAEQVERALARDDAVSAATVETPTAAAERAPDCAVVLDHGDAGIDGREQLSAALEAVDAPVVAFAVEPDGSFVRDAQSMGAADVVCTPADDPEGVLVPKVIARRIRHAAGDLAPFSADEELLDALLSNLPHEVFLKNEYGRFEAISRSKAAEYGMSREQMVGLTDFELIPELAPELTAREREIVETGEPMINSVDHYVDEDGRDRWVSVTKAPRYGGDDEVAGIIGAVRDVTEQHRQEAMLHALHAASRDLLGAETPERIAEVAVDAADDVPELPAVEVALADGDDLTSAALGGDADESPLERYEAAFRTCYETRAATAVDADGVTVRLDDRPGLEPRALALPLGEHGVLGVAADGATFDEFGVDLAEVLAANVEAVLDQAAREQELARQNERLEEFASIVSQDLRNPLSVAQGHLELLEGDDEMIGEIEWALDRMERLTDELLSLARSGEVVGETTTESIQDVAFEAWQAVDTGSATLTVDGKIGRIEADRDRLLELFENLFRNSVEHGSTSSQRGSRADDSVEHGSTSSRPEADDAVEHAHDPDDPVTVTVGALGADGESDGAARGFYVEDDGPGIPDDRTGEVFERGHTTSDEGTGLGLHIVETLADAHGWSVRVTDGETGGARFEFSVGGE